MTTQKAAKLFGWVFLLIGVLGFVPGITTADGYLLGIFQVSALHNVIHLLSGIVALLSAGSLGASKTYFKVFGIVYALVTIFGFLTGSFLGLIAVNMADNLLHLVITIGALYYGFRKEM